MRMTHCFLLALKQWKGFGVQNILTVAEYWHRKQVKIISSEDYLDLLSEVFNTRGLRRVKQLPSHIEWQRWMDRASAILDDNERQGISLVSCFDANYPECLLTAVDEQGKASIPLLVFYKGNLALASRKSIAVIGTRHPSQGGYEMSSFVAETLSRKGFVVVGGLARGCDTAAHRRVLEVNGYTSAVLAHGLDKVYPPENSRLAEDIIGNGGLLLSEYPAGESADLYKFVARDRLQAALSDAVIVVQTSPEGGAMHAVNCAGHLHRPVFAVSYHNTWDNKRAEGNRQLLDVHRASSITRTNIETVVDQITLREQ